MKKMMATLAILIAVSTITLKFAANPFARTNLIVTRA